MIPWLQRSSSDLSAQWKIMGNVKTRDDREKGRMTIYVTNHGRGELRHQNPLMQWGVKAKKEKKEIRTKDGVLTNKVIFRPTTNARYMHYEEQRQKMRLWNRRQFYHRQDLKIEHKLTNNEVSFSEGARAACRTNNCVEGVRSTWCNNVENGHRAREEEDIRMDSWSVSPHKRRLTYCTSFTLPASHGIPARSRLYREYTVRRLVKHTTVAFWRDLLLPKAKNPLSHLSPVRKVG